jgi:hypothetical protein
MDQRALKVLGVNIVHSDMVTAGHIEVFEPFQFRDKLIRPFMG